MGKLSNILRSFAGGQVAFMCPGCEEPHVVRVDPAFGSAWGYNGNPEAPTFTPSVLVTSHEWTPPVTPENMEEWNRSPWPQTKVDSVCHSFVTDGQIQFLGDCTHVLAGQTVPIPPFDDEALR